MEEAKRFGVRLKELRIRAGMTQRELASTVGIDFTYLSKIENDVMPPPSEKVILQLAEVLNADRDELLILAGKIPSDIAEILKNPEALQMLRSVQTLKKIKVPSKKGVTMPKISLPLRSLYRVAIPLILVVAVATSLWFATPTKALTITYPTLPSGNIGGTHTGRLVITIEDSEQLPVQQINMEIYNTSDTTKKATCTYLPTTSTTKAYSNTQTGNGGTVSITATTGFGWQYVTQAGYVDWKGTAYTWTPRLGYSYAYSPGSVSITYDITWTSPSGWPSGNYKIKTDIVANGDTFTEYSSSFALSAGGDVSGGAGGPPPIPAVEPGVTKVSNVVDVTGKFTQTTTAKSQDNQAMITAKKDTIGKTKLGQPLSEISIVPMTTPPAPAPAGANIITATYNFGPAGATFDPAVTMTLSYNPASIPAGVNEKDLVIAYWDGNDWIIIKDCVVDAVNHTVSGPVTHFTEFTIITPPATPTPTPPVPIPPIPTPTPPAPAPAPPVSPTLAPPTPTPVPPTPAPAPTPAPTPVTPTPTPVPEETVFNWWYVGGGIIVVIILIAIVTWRIVARRRD